ncbi:MAG TPA: hypothetical protein VER08_03415 [Pyrinomonadaceae bacterium]|nr:hypothetical protein [Pyrinomonadaceae bacterium]
MGSQLPSDFRMTLRLRFFCSFLWRVSSMRVRGLVADAEQPRRLLSHRPTDHGVMAGLAAARG